MVEETSTESAARQAAPGPAATRPARDTRDGLLAVLDQGFYSVCNFVTAVMISRFCGVADYGAFVLGFSVLVVCQVIGRSLVSVPLTIRYASLGPERRRSYLGNSGLQQAAVSLTLGAILLGAANVVRLLDPGSALSGVLEGVSVAAVAWLTLDFLRTAYMARLAVLASVALSAAVNAGTLLALALAHYVGMLSAPSAYWLMAGCAAVPSLWVMLHHRHQADLSWKHWQSDWRTNWDLGKWTLAATVVGNLGLRMLPWLVLAWYADKEVAHLGALVTVAGLINPAVIGIAVYLTPRLGASAAAQGLAHAAAEARRLFLPAAAAAVAYVLFMAVCGDWLVTLFFTRTYEGHGLALLLLATAVGLEAVYVPARSLLRVLNRTQDELWGSLASLLAIGVLGAILVPPLGVLGAAIAYVSGRLALVLMSRVLIRRALERVHATDRGLEHQPGSRLTIRAGVVTKKVPPEWAGVEAVMTQAAHDLGDSCGFFIAPRVIACDRQEGLIQFEQLTHLVQVKEYLRDPRCGPEQMRSIGRAIAMVHKQLHVAPEFSLTAPHQDGDAVPLHGDFSTLNVCVKTDTGQIVLLDWSSANALPHKITIGSRYIDLAQFLRSLVVHPAPFWTSLREFRGRATAFLEGYEAQSGRTIEAAELRRFINRINTTHLCGVIHQGTPGLRVVLRVVKCCVAMVYLLGQTHRLRWTPSAACPQIKTATGA